MGLFSKLFGPSPDIEKQLEELYIPIFQKTMGMSLGQAKKHFQGMFQLAKEESLKGNTKNLPQNSGDLLLATKSIDEKTKERLTKKRIEGVRDEDIRWWWNMHDYERWMMIKVDENSRMVLFIDEIKKSDADSEEEASLEATKKIRKFFPMYGDPDDTTHTKGNDRPLPYELKNRINIYIEKCKKKDPDKLKRDIENSSTFNSLIRNEIKNGNLWKLLKMLIPLSCITWFRRFKHYHFIEQIYNSLDHLQQEEIKKETENRLPDFWKVQLNKERIKGKTSKMLEVTLEEKRREIIKEWIEDKKINSWIIILK